MASNNLSAYWTPQEIAKVARLRDTINARAAKRKFAADLKRAKELGKRKKEQERMDQKLKAARAGARR